jgi:hypothetical protein
MKQETPKNSTVSVARSEPGKPLIRSQRVYPSPETVDRKGRKEDVWYRVITSRLPVYCSHRYFITTLIYRPRRVLLTVMSGVLTRYSLLIQLSAFLAVHLHRLLMTPATNNSEIRT